MAEFKDRSFIFKVLYILLSIITFPVFLILFIFRHPLAVITVLLFIAGYLVYCPLHAGVKLDDAAAWYQQKYTEWKHETVLKAREKGITNLVPQAMVQEVEKMEEEAEEAKLPKGENYNSKVVRSAESEEMKEQLKKRSGFKKREIVDKAEVPVEEKVNEPEVALPEDVDEMKTEKAVNDELEISLPKDIDEVKTEDIVPVEVPAENPQKAVGKPVTAEDDLELDFN